MRLVVSLEMESELGALIVERYFIAGFFFH